MAQPDDWQPVGGGDTSNVDDWTPVGSPAQAPAPAVPPAQTRIIPSTLSYLGSRLLGGIMESGRLLGASADELHPEMGPEIMALPSGQETADRWMFNAPAVAPNALARYGGAVAYSAGADPVMSALMPATSASASLAAQGAHDLLPNNPLAPMVAGTLAGGGVSALSRFAPAARGLSVPEIADSLGESSTMQQAGKALQDAAILQRTKFSWQTNQAKLESLREQGLLEDDGFSIPSKFSSKTPDEDTVDLLDKIIAAKPEDAAGRLISGARKGGTDLTLLREAGLGPAIDELAAAHLRLQGLKGWGKLSPEGQEALVPSASHREALSAADESDEAASPSTLEDYLRQHQTRNLMMGGPIGGALGAGLGGAFGNAIEGWAIGEGAGHLAGLTAPYAVRGARALARDPLRPAVGGATGAFLLPGESE